MDDFEIDDRFYELETRQDSLQQDIINLFKWKEDKGHDHKAVYLVLLIACIEIYRLGGFDWF